MAIINCPVSVLYFKQRIAIYVDACMNYNCENRPISKQNNWDSTEGGMTGDGGGKILSNVLLEGYEIMRTRLCPPLSLYDRDQTAAFETFDLITDEQDILRIPAFRTATW